MSMLRISGLNDHIIPFNFISQTELFSEKVFEQTFLLYVGHPRVW